MAHMLPQGTVTTQDLQADVCGVPLSVHLQVGAGPPPVGRLPNPSALG